MRRIPLVLIAGFLGAGKTTFLRAVMEALRERRTGFSVIVNDFENAEVDASRLRSLGTEVRAINGSCVCCSSLQEFMEALRDVEVPSGGVLLVEANGASDLISLIAAITARQECQRFTSPLQVTLADAKRWQQRGEQNELEREQVQTSTHWMVTHQGDLPVSRVDCVKAEIREISPRAIETSMAAMADYLRLLSATSRLTAADEPMKVKNRLLDQAIFSPPASPHRHHHEAGRAFTSMRVDIPFVVKRQDLERTLKALPESVIRVKGLCRLAELPQVPMSFQHVRPQAETWFLPMIHVSSVMPIGVVIGVGLPEENIACQFESMPTAEFSPAYDPNDF